MVMHMEVRTVWTIPDAPNLSVSCVRERYSIVLSRRYFITRENIDTNTEQCI